MNFFRDGIIKFITLVCLLIIINVVYVSCKVTFCYECRSRGPLGDCGDPFNWNLTNTIGHDRTTPAVEKVPCGSGWCGKTIEGKDDDPLKATDRMCLTRKPEDNTERCADTYFEHKKEKLFMCFCRGNLCNSALSISNSSYLISSILAIIFLCIQ